MKPGRRFWLRGFLGAAGLLLLAGIVAPFVRVNQFSDQIRWAIERALQRQVKIGEARLTLFTGPGLSVDDVTIYDIPEAGLEPFAHMPSMKVRFSLVPQMRIRLKMSAKDCSFLNAQRSSSFAK